MFRIVICLSLILNTLFAYTSAAQTEKEKFLIKNLQEISRNRDSLRAVGDLFIQSEYDEVRFEGLYIKGFLQLIAQQSDSAIYYYKEASKLIDKTSNQVKNRYRIYVKLLAAHNSIGKSKDFQKILDEVERIAKQNNDSALLSEFFRYKGLKLAKEGRLEEAIANQTKSAELNILLNRPELINNYLIIGNTYITLNKNNEAISWYIKSNQEAEKRRDFGTQFILKNSLGKTYQRIEKMDSAMYYYNLVLQDTSKLIVKDKIYFFHNLASYYLDVKHKDSANLYINEIEKLLNEQSKKTVTGIEFYKLKSDYYLKFNEYEKALLYADSARNLAESKEQSFKILTIYFQISDIYERMGLLDKANKSLKKYLVFKDSLNASLKTRDIQETISSYLLLEKELELKEKLENEQNKIGFAGEIIFSSIFLLIAFYLSHSIHTSIQSNHSKSNNNSENKEDSKLDTVNNVVKLKDGTLIDTEKICYIQSEGHYLNIYLIEKQKPVLERNTIKKWEEELMPNGFIRVHKSYLVNRRCILAIEPKRILLVNNNAIPFGKIYKENLEENGSLEHLMNNQI